MNLRLRKWLILHVPTWLQPRLRVLQFRVTIVLGSVLRTLPGSSRHFGPPRNVIRTLAEYVERRNRTGRGSATYIELYPSHTIARSAPRTVDPQLHPEFLQEMSRVSPAVGIAVIEQGRVMTGTGAVIGPPDCLIWEASDIGTDHPGTHPISLSPKLPRITKVAGAVAVLTTYYSNNYYHWIIDLIPRLHLLEESGLSYDKLVVPCQLRFQRESLELLGIDTRRVIFGANLHIEAAKLIVPSLPGVIGNTPDWACRCIRKSFLKYLPTAAQDRRIFVSRAKSNTRKIVNETELFGVLEDYGFERVFLEDLPFFEQVRLFNTAAIVVSPHGSGLVNLVFCRERTSVVEIFSPHYVNVVYWALSNQLNLDYSYVQGTAKIGVSVENGRVHEDISVDVSQMRRVMKEIDRRRSPAATSSVHHELPQAVSK